MGGARRWALERARSVRGPAGAVGVDATRGLVGSDRRAKRTR